MKTIIAFAAMLAVAFSAPQGRNDGIILVKETPLDNIGVGGYSFGYELSDGAARQESGKLLYGGTGGAEEPLAVSGSYTWIDPETNQRYTVTYTADENGYHPVGDHIPA